MGVTESPREGPGGMDRGVASSLSALLYLLCAPGQQGSTPTSEVTPTYLSLLDLSPPQRGLEGDTVLLFSTTH